MNSEPTQGILFCGFSAKIIVQGRPTHTFIKPENNHIGLM
jgi:hypothetical protein